MADPTPAAALSNDDYQALYGLLTSSDEAQRTQGQALSKKLTPAEGEAFFTFQHAANKGKNADASVDRNIATVGGVGIAPEDLLMGGQAARSVAGAMGGEGLSLAQRGVAGVKALAGQVTPVIKYEMTKSTLQSFGVPAPLAMGVAMAVSGYKGGSKGAAADTAASTAKLSDLEFAQKEVAAGRLSPSVLPGIERARQAAARTAAPAEAVGPVETPAAPSAAPPAPLGPRLVPRPTAPPVTEPPVGPSEPAPPPVGPQESAPAPAAPVKAMSPQQTLNELAIAARRAKVSLATSEYPTLITAVKAGATPAEAVGDLIRQRATPPADTPVAAAPSSAPASSSFANLPSAADVAARRVQASAPAAEPSVNTPSTNTAAFDTRMRALVARKEAQVRNGTLVSPDAPPAAAAKSPQRAGRTTGNDYLNELVNYGGEMMPRGEVIKDLTAQGGTPAQIDRYVQGLERGGPAAPTPAAPSAASGKFTLTAEEYQAAQTLLKRGMTPAQVQASIEAQRALLGRMGAR